MISNRSYRLYRFAIWGLLSLSPGVAVGDEASRQRALKHLDKWTKIVRQNMDTRPDDVGQLLAYGMARDIGDDPRVLDLCEEVITKSKNPVSVDHAVGALYLILIWHTPVTATRRRERLRRVLNEALEHPEWGIKLSAASTLDKMSTKDAKTSHDLYVKILREPPDDRNFGELDRQWPGSAKGLQVEVIRRLLSRPDSDDIPIIRYATKRDKLLEYWEAHVRRISHIPLRETETKFMDQWKAAVGG